MFETTAGSDFASSHFPLRRTSWGDHQTSGPYDQTLEQPQLYPPTYPEGQSHGQPMVPPERAVDLVGPRYYPSPHTAGYSPPPYVPAEEAQPDTRSLHVVAPTPVNLVIQTNFTRVEHNYYYPNPESDTSSGYGSTPPTTASPARSSFSFSSTDSPTSPYDQTQELTVGRTSQNHLVTHGLYLPYPPRHQHEAGDSRYHQGSPLAEHETSPYQSSPDERLYPHGACYTRSDRQYSGCYESTDRDCGYESEPESDGGWATCPMPGYGFYATPNPATQMWRHPSWFLPGVSRSDSGYTGSVGAADTGTNDLGSVGRPTDYDVQSR